MNQSRNVESQKCCLFSELPLLCVFTSEDMKKYVTLKNACVFTRDLYVLC